MKLLKYSIAPCESLIPLTFEVIFNYDNFSRWHKVTRIAQS